MAADISKGHKAEPKGKEMPTIKAEPEQLSIFANATIDGPIVMVNLLRFKPDGGAAAYAKYRELAAPHVLRVGAKLLYAGAGRSTVIGEDHWDLVLLVEYPSREAFLEMVMTPEYQELAQYRTDALEDSRLYCTQAENASVAFR